MLATVVLFPLILGFINYATEHELGFFVFYFLPIAIAAWKTNPIGAYLVSILSAIVCFLSDIYSSPSYSSGFIPVWNGTIRLISFLIIAYCTSRFDLCMLKNAIHHTIIPAKARR